MFSLFFLRDAEGAEMGEPYKVGRGGTRWVRAVCVFICVVGVEVFSWTSLLADAK